MHLQYEAAVNGQESVHTLRNKTCGQQQFHKAILIVTFVVRDNHARLLVGQEYFKAAYEALNSAYIKKSLSPRFVSKTHLRKPSFLNIQANIKHSKSVYIGSHITAVEEKAARIVSMNEDGQCQ